MKGYKYPRPNLEKIEWVSERIFVGCRRCRNTWYEFQTIIKNSPRINGPDYCYDYCDKCKKGDE